MSAVTLRVGTDLQWQGGGWTVVAFHEQGLLTIRSSLGERVATDLVALVDDPSFSVGARDAEPLDRAATFAALPAAMRRQAEDRLAHLHEARTGFRSGHTADALPGEPRPQYDPDVVGLTQRMQSKANELGVHLDTLYDRWNRVSSSSGAGLLELIDRRRLRHTLAEEHTDWRVREAIEAVLKDLSKDHASRVGEAEKRRLVRRELRTRFPDADVDAGSDSTLDRRIARIAHQPGRRAANRRPDRRPKTPTPYRRMITSRPGEVVLIDSTMVNFMVLDPKTLTPARAWLTTAEDHFSRCILALRVTVDPIASEEASLLLADMVRPLACRAHWPERARWRYHGIPETIVASIREEWRITDLAAKPPLVSQLCVVDGAWATKSHAFWAACRHIGTDLQIARPMTPTDKAQKERFYGTINRWQEAMPGHVGRNATERGVGVEQKACLLPSEAEDLFWQYVLGIYHCTEHDGLVLPDAPEHPISPNRMYDIGVTASGMVRLPPDPDIYFELLPVQWRALQDGAISIHNRPFDDDALELLRGKQSPYPHVKPNVWPFRVDRRNLSQVYVKVPGEGWHSVRSVLPDATDTPFGRTATHAAKCLPQIDQDEGFLSRRASGVQLDAWLDQQDAQRPKRGRRDAATVDDRTRAAAADLDTTTLSERESATRKHSAAQRIEDDDLGDFSPTIYDVGARR
jgi:putative transposase